MAATGAGDAADEDVQRIMAALGRARPDVTVVDLLAAVDRAERANGPSIDYEVARLMADFKIASDTRDFAALAVLPERGDALLERAGPNADDLRGLVAMIRLMARRADAASFTSLPDIADDFERVRAAFGPNDPARVDLIPLQLQLIALMASLGADPSDPDGVTDADIVEIRRIARRVPGGNREIRASTLSALGRMTVARAAQSPATITDGIILLRAAVRRSHRGDQALPFYLIMLGTALLRRVEAVRAAPNGNEARKILTRLRPYAALDRETERALSLLRRAVDETGAPSHPFWAYAGMALADGYRRAGRPAEARATGRRALAGSAWQVLLQSHAAAASTASILGPATAMTVAGWCIEDGDADGAVVALDAARGPILFAATEIDDVPARLVAAGATDLAERWPADGAEIPGELRRAAFERLTLRGTVLEPPSTDDVRAALDAAGFDALVYLVPGDPGDPGPDPMGMLLPAPRPGAAVVVPARGPTVIVPLPELAEPPFRMTGDPGRDIQQPPRPRPPERLEELGAWAWRVAIGPLLDALPAGPDAALRDAGRSGAGPSGAGPPRLVLVPMGALAAVPWHAARGPDGYAVERAVFSSAVSARMFCRTLPGTSDGPVLVVGDPDTTDPGTGRSASTLLGARREALAVHAAHPDSRYVGRLADGRVSPDGAGTPDEVLGWTGRVLHLACHGSVAAGRVWGDTSYLLLAGGRRLAAEQVVAARGTRRPGLVVLAACHTSVSGRGEDEAFSVGTAFLAGGSSSVVAAQWAVPDDATSDLILAFHRHLRDGERPVDALRAAQIEAIRDGPGDGPAAWAAFVHFGR